MAPLVKRDRERVFKKDWLVNKFDASDPKFSVFASVSSVMEVLRLGGIYCQYLKYGWNTCCLIILLSPQKKKEIFVKAHIL